MATKSLCSIPDCGKPRYGHGWCYAHWARWRRHGDPLGGRISPGEPLRYYVEVVLAYEGDECLIWPFNKSGHGYGQMMLEGRKITVSRLVCEELNGPPPTPDHEAAHSCGKGHLGCVTKRHLSWKTHAENMAGQIEHGRRAQGERHGSAKLTQDDARSIRALRGIMPQTKIAEMFGVSRATIGDIQTGRKWGWLFT